MSARTVYLARLIGLFCAAIGLAMAVNHDATLATFLAFANDPAALWLSAMTGLAAGLALVLGHNVWRGGARAVVVTLVGWVVTLKCAVVLVLPAGALTVPTAWLMAPAFYYADVAFILVLGLYLIAAGFRAPRP